MKLNGSCHCGAVSWKLNGSVDGITACNCTVCRRYGVLWAYGYEGDEIYVSGATAAYSRNEKYLEFHFCATCGCVSYWRSNHLGSDGKRRIAVNVRLIDDPALISDLPIDHFEGLEKFEDLPRDGKTVRDLWF